jgi:hypothetical protein
LSINFRAILIAWRARGDTYRAIAEQSGVPEGTLKTIGSGVRKQPLHHNGEAIIASYIRTTGTSRDQLPQIDATAT